MEVVFSSDPTEQVTEIFPDKINMEFWQAIHKHLGLILQKNLSLLSFSDDLLYFCIFSIQVLTLIQPFFAPPSSLSDNLL